MNDIIVYKNKYEGMRKFYSIIGVIIFLVTSILFQMTNNLLVLLIFPASFLFGFILYAGMPNTGLTHYQSITLNNEKNQLIFSSLQLDEIFTYKDIVEIKVSKDGKLIHLDIRMKSGMRKRMSFAKVEFNLDFLNKLPKTINVNLNLDK